MRIDRFALCCLVLVVLLFGMPANQSYAQSIAFTFDDGFYATESRDRAVKDNESMLAALKKYGIHSMLFPTGTVLESPDSFSLVKAWGQAGHTLGNHTFTHSSLSQTRTDVYVADILKAEGFLKPLQGWCAWLRFPYLDEGANPDQRNQVLQWLSRHGYGVAAVTVTLPDWEYAERYDNMLLTASKADLAKFKSSYVEKVFAEIGKQRAHWISVLGRDLPQTLLLHTNHLNAEILPALLAKLKKSGWTFITPQLAYEDPVYQRRIFDGETSETAGKVLQNPGCP